jgi:hypothetical protein
LDLNLASIGMEESPLERQKPFYEATIVAWRIRRAQKYLLSPYS